MSEEVTTQAPAAPEVAPAPTPEKVTPEPARHRRRDVRNAVHDRLHDRASAQVRNEAGKFAKPGATATEPAAPVEKKVTEVPKEAPAAEPAAEVVAGEVAESPKPDEAPAAAPVVAEPPAPEKPAAGKGLVKIQLDPRNPLWDQGITELEVPPHLERHVRTLGNAAIRSREVDQMATQLQQMQMEHMRTQARLEALQSADAPNVHDPRIQTMIQELEGSEFYGPEVAQQVKAALSALQAQHVSKAEQEATGRFQQIQKGTTFIEQVKEAAPGAFPAWGENLAARVVPLMVQYGNMVDARIAFARQNGLEEMHPDFNEFMSFARGQYLSDPKSVEHARRYQDQWREQERGRIREEEQRALREAEAKRLAEANRRHSEKPPSPPPAKSQGTTRPPEKKPGQGVPFGSRKSAIRSGIHERLSANEQ